jgi:hypothetical protein
MKKNSDPLPEQIAELCLQIQSTWSHRERMSRLRADWRPMFTRCDGEKLEIEAADYERHHESSVAYRS